MRYGVIYKITNTITGKCYIGQTTRSVYKRFNDHYKERRGRHISSTIRKYGKENFSIEELISCFSKEDLNFFEIYFVENFNSMYPKGYNHRAGGCQNGICSDETRTRISKSKLGKKIPKLQNRDISIRQRLQISKALNGKQIVAVSCNDGSIRVYETAHSTKIDKHNPSNIIQICKKKGRRKISKGYYFYYIDDYANQSGRSKSNILEHAQRIGVEPDKVGIQDTQESSTIND